MRIQNILMAAALGASITTPASAQLGGLMRKAKEAAATKVVEKTVVASNKNLKSSDTFGPELTDASLDAVLRGLAAMQTAHGQIEQLRLKGQEYQAAYTRSVAAHGDERTKFESASNRIRSCQDSIVDARSTAAQEAYMKRMVSDPVAQAAMIKAARELATKNATTKDTAEMRRAYEDLAKAQGLDPKADSAVATKQCGVIPVTPAWLVEQDSLGERARRAERDARDLEYKSGDDAANAAGMTSREFALARERLLHWYRETHGGSPVQAFGKDERKLLESRKADIEKFDKFLS
jgi:hypothetical protein